MYVLSENCSLPILINVTPHISLRQLLKPWLDTREPLVRVDLLVMLVPSVNRYMVHLLHRECVILNQKSLGSLDPLLFRMMTTTPTHSSGNIPQPLDPSAPTADPSPLSTNDIRRELADIRREINVVLADIAITLKDNKKFY